MVTAKLIIKREKERVYFCSNKVCNNSGIFYPHTNGINIPKRMVHGVY